MQQHYQRQYHFRRHHHLYQQNDSSKLILLLLSVIVSAGRGDHTECSLRCMNGSKCVTGNTTFANHPKHADGSDLPFHKDKASDDNFHCACEEGFTGLTCAVAYESCADSSLVDSHKCYHGASCLPIGHDDFGNRQHQCDCTKIAGGEKYYTGKYCQEEHSVEFTCDHKQGIFCKNGGVCTKDSKGGSFCKCNNNFQGSLCELNVDVPCGDISCQNGAVCLQTDQGDAFCDCSQANDPEKRFMGKSCDEEVSIYCDESREFFCLNGGECVDQSGAFACTCPEGWHGESCELDSLDHASFEGERCDSECFNGGTCVRQVRIPVDSEEESSSLMEDHCVCPEGWTGPKCQYAYEKCGNGQQLCLHGSKCVETTGIRKKWTCECEESYQENRNHIGGFCQHHQMTVCTTSDAAFQMYDGSASSMYCVNDGLCAEIEDKGRKFPACQCPIGYTGPHCEFPGSQVFVNDKNGGLRIASSVFTVFGFILLVVAICVCIGIAMVQRILIKNLIAESPNERLMDDPIPAWLSHEDFDLQSLEDVELL